MAASQKLLMRRFMRSARFPQPRPSHKLYQEGGMCNALSYLPTKASRQNLEAPSAEPAIPYREGIVLFV